MDLWKPPNFWIDMKAVKNLKELWKLIIERREEIPENYADWAGVP